MIDAPGPWGTGPFTLVEGHSIIDPQELVVSDEPFHSTWSWTPEDRTSRLRMVANTDYWNRARGPRLEEVVMRSDLDHARALELVCDAEGEVDLVTDVAPADAARVDRSPHARLVKTTPVRALVGIIDRDAEGLPLADRRARQALNLAIDRAALVREAMHGHARPLASLTPPTPLTLAHLAPDRLAPYPHDPALARRLWHAAAGAAPTRPLRLAAAARRAAVARQVARDLEHVLGLAVEVRLHDAERQREDRRDLAERCRPRDWDVLLLEHVAQAADTPPHELHRGFVGATGEYRAGPVLDEFEALYAGLVAQTARPALVRESNRIDRFVRREALALFLCAPQDLYAVNRHVRFRPYRTTFELAECRVAPGHWSRRGRRAQVSGR